MHTHALPLNCHGGRQDISALSYFQSANTLSVEPSPSGSLTFYQQCVDGGRVKQCASHLSKRKEGKKWGDSGEKGGGRGLWFGYHSNGINGCVGFKLAPDDSGGLTVFLSVIGRFPPITHSLSLCPHPL